MSGPREDASDAELLADHVGGNPDAFGLLFARHRDRLWAVALRTTGDREDAADGLQDGMVAAYRRAGSFRGEAAVTTWLHRVVVNACLDRIRAARVRRAEPLPEDLEGYAHRDAQMGAGDPGDAGEDPADRSVREEHRRSVLTALASLAPEQRAALVLVDMEGYPVVEVAQMLDCAVGTVKSRCSRGRARLAVLLEELRPHVGSVVDSAHRGAGNQDQPPPVPPSEPGNPSISATEAPRGPPGPD